MTQGHRPALVGAGILAGFAVLVLLSSEKPVEIPLAVGQEASGPWWMRPTALSSEGHFLGLKNRTLWKKALDLLPGESFFVDERGIPKDRILIRKETVALDPDDPIEAIVWVIDDGEDGSLSAGGDFLNDCYVVDFECDGIVDRIVDYIEGDENGVPNEVEIREFENGALKSVLVLRGDLEEDGPWRISGYDLVIDRNASFPKNAVLYRNLFDPDGGRWIASGLCPLTASEIEPGAGPRTVTRIHVDPVRPNPDNDPEGQAGVSIRDIQLGFLFGGPERGTLQAGLAMSGQTLFEAGATAVFHPKRRPPQETVVILPETLAETAAGFPAGETGFSWREGPDARVSGAETESGTISAELWDDLFWTWERRSLKGAGISRRDWNIRREWSGRPSELREYYYSGVDRKIHLVGAEEGWIRVGHFAGLGDTGEIRMYDTDGNGFFDRWEFHLPGRARPVFSASVQDEKVRRLGSDLNEAVLFYRAEVLPMALAENGIILEAIRSFRDFDLPAELKAAAAGVSAIEGRYAQDVLRDLAFFRLRDFLSTHSAQALIRDSREGPSEYFEKYLGIRPTGRGRLPGESGWTGDQAWTIAGLLARIEEAYGQGDYSAAAGWIARIKDAIRLE